MRRSELALILFGMLAIIVAAGYRLVRLLNDASRTPLPTQAKTVEVLIAGNNNPAISQCCPVFTD